jgi:hypothetical protein
MRGIAFAGNGLVQFITVFGFGRDNIILDGIERRIEALFLVMGASDKIQNLHNHQYQNDQLETVCDPHVNSLFLGTTSN